MDEIQHLFPTSKYVHPHGAIILCVRSGNLTIKRFRIYRWEIEDPYLLKKAIKKIAENELETRPNSIIFRIWVNINPEEYRVRIKNNPLEVVISRMFISLFNKKYIKDFYTDDDRTFAFLERMSKYAI